MFSHLVWYLFSVKHSHLASSASGLQLCLCLSYSQNSPSLVTLPILPAWILANQCFIKPICVTNLYSMQEHYPTSPIWTKQATRGLSLKGVSCPQSSICSPYLLSTLRWFLRKLRINLPQNPATSVLGIYPKGCSIILQGRTTRTFIQLCS